MMKQWEDVSKEDEKITVRKWKARASKLKVCRRCLSFLCPKSIHLEGIDNLRKKLSEKMEEEVLDKYKVQVSKK